MKLQQGMTAIVTGGVSGLGEATAHDLVARGLNVVAVDLNDERGNAMQSQYQGQLRYVKADVTNAEQMTRAVEAAQAFGNLRALVHCAGIGGPVRLIEKDGSAGSLEKYTHIVSVNLIGSFNVLRLAAVAMAANEPVDGERGACVLTASVVRQSLGASVPNPSRLGHPSEFSMTALHILENPMLNGETIRLDGAIRMQPR